MVDIDEEMRAIAYRLHVNRRHQDRLRRLRLLRGSPTLLRALTDRMKAVIREDDNYGRRYEIDYDDDNQEQLA